jgi:hypothetical protein
VLTHKRLECAKRAATRDAAFFSARPNLYKAGSVVGAEISYGVIRNAGREGARLNDVNLFSRAGLKMSRFLVPPFSKKGGEK